MDTVVICIAAFFLVCWVIVLKLRVADREETIKKLKQELNKETRLLTHQVDVDIGLGGRSGSDSTAPEKHPTRVVHRPG